MNLKKKSSSIIIIFAITIKNLMIDDLLQTLISKLIPKLAVNYLKNQKWISVKSYSISISRYFPETFHVCRSFPLCCVSKEI